MATRVVVRLGAAVVDFGSAIDLQLLQRPRELRFGPRGCALLHAAPGRDQRDARRQLFGLAQRAAVPRKH